MSTRIYSGYKLNIDNVIKFRIELQKKFFKVLKKQGARNALESAVELYDELTFNDGRFRNETSLKRFPKHHPFDGKFSTCLKAVLLEDLSDIRRDEQGFIPNFTINFYWDEVTEAHYAILWTNSENERIFKKLPEVEDFSYWNSSDRPGKISKAEWKLREEVWNRVVPRNEEKHFMVTASIMDEYDKRLTLTEFKGREKLFPSLESRIKYLTSRYLSGEFHSQNPNLELGEIFSKSSDYILSEENRARVRPSIEATIERKITLS